MKPILIISFFFLATESFSQQNDDAGAHKKNDSLLSVKQADSEAIKAINKKYVAEWLNNNETGVLSLFTNDASLAPSGLAPVKGIAEIKKFWFPVDGSVTAILKFTNDIQNIYIEEDIAETNQIDHLLWSYKNGSVSFAKEQWGFATTVYQKQSNGEWKIIHQMWKDYRVIDK